MSNIFIYFTVSLPFCSRDVSIAISNLLQMTTARWRHGSHSAQTSLSHDSTESHGRRGGGQICRQRVGLDNKRHQRSDMDKENQRQRESR